MDKLWPRALLALLFAGVLLPAAVFADSGAETREGLSHAFQVLSGAAGREGPHSVMLDAAAVTMDEAVRMVEQQFKARVVRAEAQHEGGHTIYVMRLLNDSGRVWTVRVDAASGTIL